MKKNVTRLLLTFVIFFGVVFSLTTLASAATVNVTGWKLTYTQSNGEVTVTGGTRTGTSASLEIPAKINGYPVTKIGDLAFKNNTNLCSLTLPQSITYIGESAFEGTLLYNIYGDTNLTHIGDYAFYGCDRLETFTIPDSVTHIGYEAFYNCQNLTTITIPKNVTYIDGGAFKKCYGLKNAVIPEGVTVIRSRAFEDCGLQSITLSDSVEAIESQAFKSCDSLESVILSGNLKTIGELAFSECKNLKNISIPKSVETIGNSAFSDCYGLTKIVIPEGVKEIGNSAFKNCYSLSDVTISDSVKVIGSYAFDGCKRLEKITLPKGVEVIGAAPFAKCEKLTSLNVSGENKYFVAEDNILFTKDKTHLIQYLETKTADSYVIPNTVVTVGEGAFYGCGALSEITIPKTVKEIGARAFCACSGLTEIVIPDGVASIGQYTFSGCNNLINIVIPDSVTAIGANAFDSTAYYKDSANWENNVLYIGKHLIRAKNISGDYKAKDGTLSIAKAAFDNCKNLTAISIPGSVSYIESSMFALCTNIKTVHLGDGIKTISENMFDSCKKLESITIPNSLETIEKAAFYGSGLKKVYYKGTKEDWEKIKIDTHNGQLINVAEIIYTAFTKSTVSENKKAFTVKPVNIQTGKTVVLALYNGGIFVEMQPAQYIGEELIFNTKANYTEAKIMVWDNLKDLSPVSETETIR